MPAKIIALEGIDQSGKRTQTRLLLQHLHREGFKVSQIAFPIYGTASGKEIQAFLNGRRDYPPEAVHMLYSLNRWENLGSFKKLLARSDFVVANRYVPSNLTYGLARGLGLSWLKCLDEGLPKAQLVLVLDVSIPASFARKSKQRDVHERNREFLQRVRRAYKFLSRRMRWRIINAERPPETVHMDIWNQVREKF